MHANGTSISAAASASSAVSPIMMQRTASSWKTRSRCSIICALLLYGGSLESRVRMAGKSESTPSRSRILTAMWRGLFEKTKKRDAKKEEACRQRIQDRKKKGLFLPPATLHVPRARLPQLV